MNVAMKISLLLLSAISRQGGYKNSLAPSGGKFPGRFAKIAITFTQKAFWLFHGLDKC
jgi:hypothetical protein